MLSIILVEPENPGNVGAVCRVMKNFGFEKLVILGQGFDLNSEELRNRAKWANDLVDKIKAYKNCDKRIIKKIRKDYDYLIATTAKIGRDYNILRSPISPEQLAERLSEINLKKGRKNRNSSETSIGILIGRESSGLTNEEIRLCDFTVSIPTSKKYGTMNMSHATAIILYEIFKAFKKESIITHINPISQREKEQLMKLLDDTMKKMSFLNDDKKETQRIVWKKMLSKSFLSRREAYALMGFLKKIQK